MELHGRHVLYFDENKTQVMAVLNYDNNVLHGEVIRYNKSGNIIYSGHYTNGKKDKTFIVTDKTNVVYDNGLLITMTKNALDANLVYMYDKNGPLNDNPLYTLHTTFNDSKYVNNRMESMWYENGGFNTRLTKPFVGINKYWFDIHRNYDTKIESDTIIYANSNEDPVEYYYRLERSTGIIYTDSYFDYTYTLDGHPITVEIPDINIDNIQAVHAITGIVCIPPIYLEV